jgi:hypothetical protein
LFESILLGVDEPVPRICVWGIISAISIPLIQDMIETSF